MIKYDNSKQALFAPQSLNFESDVSKCILIFDDIVWEDYVLHHDNVAVVPVKNTFGRVFNNYLLLKNNEEDILLVFPAFGASASAVELELLIASGVNIFLSFGTCGRLDNKIPKNSIIIPTSAIREEGTSYHYLSDSDEVSQKKDNISLIQRIMSKESIYYSLGKIWTTDAVYRETENKVDMMIEKGCIGVDMELSALLSVAKFRGVNLASFLIGDDLVLGKNSSSLKRDNEKIFSVALEILNNLA